MQVLKGTYAMCVFQGRLSACAPTGFQTAGEKLCATHVTMRPKKKQSSWGCHFENLTLVHHMMLREAWSWRQDCVCASMHSNARGVHHYGKKRTQKTPHASRGGALTDASTWDCAAKWSTWSILWNSIRWRTCLGKVSGTWCWCMQQSSESWHHLPDPCCKCLHGRRSSLAFLHTPQHSCGMRSSPWHPLCSQTFVITHAWGILGRLQGLQLPLLGNLA